MSKSVDSSPRIGVKFRHNAHSKSLKDESLRRKLEHRLSRSASELGGIKEQEQCIQYGGVEPSPSGSRHRGHLPPEDSVGHPTTVVQRTQAFFSSLKERWLKGRCRDRSKRHEGSDGDEESIKAASVCEVGEKTRLKKITGLQHSAYSTDYAADYSSEYSSSATPLNQSPFKTTTQPSQTTNGLRSQKMGDTSAVDGVPFQDRSFEGQIAASVSSTFAMMESDELKRASELEKASRELMFKQYSFFQLKVHLKRGQNLIARDKSGTSDPYVKFKVNGKMMYKSKTIYRDLNPVWDEVFTLPIDDPFSPVHIKVFDYDWGLQDDFMGAAYLELTNLDFGRPAEIVLPLQDGRGDEYLGEIVLNVTMWPKSQEDREQYYQRSTRSESSRRLKSQIWSSVVTIVLIKGTNLLPMDDDGLSDPYVKFRLGNEKYKSRVMYKTLNPNWLEQFDLHMYDDTQELEITVWDKDRTKDDFIGRCVVDLNKFDRETTHKIIQELEEGAGFITFLLTISGTTASETISDLTTYEENRRELQILEERYAFKRSLHNLRDVGHLTVKVYKAQGLAAADLGGKSDPFCVLELVNARLQTQTEYKTLTPSWQKIFTFNVKDIHSVLEVTVYDEDKDHKVEFLGKVAIPLLKIRNNEKRWYALKDKKLRGRAKGNSPQILLKMNVIWNVVRACIRTLNPKEEKYMQIERKFKRQIFVRNVMRLKNILMYFVEIGKFIQNCFEWESTFQSTVALIVFIILCHYAELYMVPIGLLLIFLKCYIVQVITGSTLGWNAPEIDDYMPTDDDDDDEDKDKEEKKSLKERLQAIQEVTQTVQNAIGYIASLGESIKNTFNFTVPFLSYLSIILLILITIVLYMVPLRYLIMVWGINKFTRKLFRPHVIPNNELLDLLSRVPDDEDLISYKEIKPQPTSDTDTRLRRKRKAP